MCGAGRWRVARLLRHGGWGAIGSIRTAALSNGNALISFDGSEGVSSWLRRRVLMCGAGRWRGWPTAQAQGGAPHQRSVGVA
jgi:hypothetical protein